LHTLNLGILAHVDAGKTTLTERLLHAAGVIDTIGSVDDGNTMTDSLALERQRGITIKSAVVTFAIDDLTVNLIDTPGHPDFIAEVERVLGVLDGAVLVISAVEGVQPQTVVLMRTLRRLGIPTLLFVNKIDRRGAGDERVLRAIAERLTPDLVAMGVVTAPGSKAAGWSPYTEADFVTRVAERLADHDDALLEAYVDHPDRITEGWVSRELAAQTAAARVHPVYFGSAITGAGVESLTAGIRTWLPASAGDADGPVSGTVFKVERGAAGERVAYVRLYAGTLRTRDRLPLPGQDERVVTAISVFDRGAGHRGPVVEAGQIAKVWGLGAVRIGDPVGAAHASRSVGFRPPTLETVVVPRRRADAGLLHAALTELAEQDPLINLRHDEQRHEVSVSLYGEVQKEVIEATLAEEYGVAVSFRETTTICIERPVGVGAAHELLYADSNPFLATVGLRVQPSPPGSGLRFALGVELGSMPVAFFRAVQETLPEALQQGLYGWQVTDLTVTMTRSGYWPRQSRMHGTFDKSMSSTAGDFRNLTPLVLVDALRRAGTRVCEPVHAFRLELPPDTLPAVLPALTRLGAVPLATGEHAVEGEIPAARVHAAQQQLPALTRGEGLLETAFDRYEPVRGPAPTRPPTGNNPLDRKEYLLRVARRTAP
jgi:ribosomal protection tetracycline resistance protein